MHPYMARYLAVQRSKELRKQAADAQRARQARQARRAAAGGRR